MGEWESGSDLFLFLFHHFKTLSIDSQDTTDFHDTINCVHIQGGKDLILHLKYDFGPKSTVNM